ncbi:hypothetical protein CN085_31615 [Sinorhizobium meliloti]|nr:hypothetical protein CN085_31615 [Sinorhizobium meliloti]
MLQDVYEWAASHTRNESSLRDSAESRSAASLKAVRPTCPGSRLEMGINEALKPIRDPQALRDATPEEFAGRAGRVLSELNYVHPFREGTDVPRRRLFSELGRHYGHEIDFSVAAKPRMLEATIETTTARPVP